MEIYSQIYILNDIVKNVQRSVVFVCMLSHVWLFMAMHLENPKRTLKTQWMIRWQTALKNYSRKFAKTLHKEKIQLTIMHMKECPMLLILAIGES